MGNLLFSFLYWVVMVPGYPFTIMFSKFKLMGDGTGNESSTIDFHIWSTIFGIFVWVFVIAGGMWIWNNLSFSLLIK